MNNEIIETTETCEKHGIEYKVMKSFLLGKEMIRKSDGCSKCASEEYERRVKEQRETEELTKKLRLDNCIATFEADIPKRFKDACFDTYEAKTEEQKRALKICKTYVEKFSEKILKTGGGLILSGQVGTGKTHLALSIGKELSQKSHFVRYVNLMGLIRYVRSAWTDDTKNEDDLIYRIQNVDLLIVDEVGVQAGSDNERNILFEIINGRYEEMKPTIVISNLNKDGIANLISERSVDRIVEGGAMVPFTWESYRAAKGVDDE